MKRLNKYKILSCFFMFILMITLYQLLITIMYIKQIFLIILLIIWSLVFTILFTHYFTKIFPKKEIINNEKNKI